MVQKVLADGGYTGKAFASSVQESIGAEVEIAKRNELHRFAVLPKRWVSSTVFPGWKRTGGFGNTASIS